MYITPPSLPEKRSFHPSPAFVILRSSNFQPAQGPTLPAELRTDPSSTPSLLMMGKDMGLLLAEKPTRCSFNS